MLRVPRQVLVYLFRDSGEVLLLKRTEQWGGFWQGVSGAPEWDETDDEGAIREVRETSFDVAGSLRRIEFRYELLRESDPDGDRWEQLYGADVRAIPEEVYVAIVPDSVDPELAPYEHDALRWCSVEDALKLLTWENNRRALVAAAQFVASTRP